MNIQTAKSPKKMGRPPGKKSDPAYRQVTIYIPAELHDATRNGVKDFSLLIEQLLHQHLQTSKSKNKSQTEMAEMVAALKIDQANLIAMSDEEFNSSLPASEDTENIDHEHIDEAKQWAAVGLITPRELKRIIAAYSKSDIGFAEGEFLLQITRRARQRRNSAE